MSRLEQLVVDGVDDRVDRAELLRSVREMRRSQRFVHRLMSTLDKVQPRTMRAFADANVPAWTKRLIDRTLEAREEWNRGGRRFESVPDR